MQLVILVFFLCYFDELCWIGEPLVERVDIFEYFCRGIVSFDDLLQVSRVHIGPIQCLINPLQTIRLSSGLAIVEQLVVLYAVF